MDVSMFIRRYFSALCIVVFCASGACFAEGLVFLSPNRVDLLKFLAPPPAPQSEAQKRDLAAVLDVQKNRTPELIARALADSELSIFRYDDVLGPNFTPDRLPITVNFFKKMHADARVILNATKEAWNRPRPCNINTDVKPLGERPRTAFAYPSGTTIFGSLTAIVLANMVPEKHAELFARGAEYSANRVVLGIHYPTDIEAGRIAAAVMAAALFDTPSFLTELEAAKSELRRVLGIGVTDPVVAGGRGEGDVESTGSIRSVPAAPPQ